MPQKNYLEKNEEETISSTNIYFIRTAKGNKKIKSYLSIFKLKKSYPNTKTNNLTTKQIIGPKDLLPWDFAWANRIIPLQPIKGAPSTNFTKNNKEQKGKSLVLFSFSIMYVKS